MNLLEPTCPFGYTTDDLKKIFGNDIDDFWYYMRGKTISLCDGTTYDHERKGYVTTECSGMLPGIPVLREEIPYALTGHGGVVYTRYVERYIRGLSVID